MISMDKQYFLAWGKKLFTCLGLLLFSTTAFAQPSMVKTVTIESKELNQSREIMIYTPMGYEEFKHNFYNVIYVFDAQNREFFDFVSSYTNLSKDKGQGTLVVGIKATLITETDENGNMKLIHGRNQDFVPSDSKLWGGMGKAEKFLAYVKNEVVPYVESNYRTLPGRTGVGHSLGASFMVYALTEAPEVFNNYIAVTPNLAYDDQRLVKKLRNFNTENLSTPKYLYLSHADEFKTWKSWGPANKAADALVQDTLASENFFVTVENYPEQTHMGVFIPSAMTAMDTYLTTIKPKWDKDLSEETYEVTFRVTVMDEEDDVFIFGNQESLANWENGQIKMNKVSPLVREISLPVQDHVVLSFSTDGKTDAWIKTGPMARTKGGLMMRPVAGATYEFELMDNRTMYAN